MHQAERGLFELQRGRIVCVTDEAGPDTLVAAVDGLTDATLRTLGRFAGTDRFRLAITAHRAAAMGLAPNPAVNGDRSNGRRAALSLGLPAAPSAEPIVRLASATGKSDLAELARRDAAPQEAAALGLLRIGRLLPAVVSAPLPASRATATRRLVEDGTILQVPPHEIEAMTADGGGDVTLVSEASVPLPEAGDARFLLFRETHGLFEHVAVVLGAPAAGDAPFPVRLHSACVTGDLFESLRCDCGDQLRGSMRLFTRTGRGALLYLAHEGRSIGLANKLRAYAMQEEGLDTLDADCALGFGPDERSYGAAVRILGHLGVERIRLLTNNPEKVRAMEEAGIRVTGREALHGNLNAHNLPYLSAKARRQGHWIDGMLSKPLPRGR